jgi:hypothetical protein
METNKVTRLEIIDHTRTVEEGGGRAYTYWHEYDKKDDKKPVVECVLQDEGRTLKVFIKSKV